MSAVAIVNLIAIAITAELCFWWRRQGPDGHAINIKTVLKLAACFIPIYLQRFVAWAYRWWVLPIARQAHERWVGRRAVRRLDRRPPVPTLDDPGQFYVFEESAFPVEDGPASALYLVRRNEQGHYVYAPLPSMSETA